jgi:hypothetical protein
MDSAKRCREQSAECLSLKKSAQGEIEASILKDLAQSWVRLANQIERYATTLKRADRASPNQIDILIGQPGVRALDPTPDLTAPKG